MSEDSRYVYIPRPQSIAEPGVIPAGPLLFTDALRDQRRWSAYYGQPRGTLAPSIIGFRGLGALPSQTVLPGYSVSRGGDYGRRHDGGQVRRGGPAPFPSSAGAYFGPTQYGMSFANEGALWAANRSRVGVPGARRGAYNYEYPGRDGTYGLGQCGPMGCPCTGLGSCCSSCARGGPCAGKGTAGLYSSIQTPTNGYGVPVLVGAGIGYLTERKTGALVGAALGAFFRWVWGKAEPTVMPIVDAVTPTPVSGFTDDFRWNPTMTATDSSLSKAQFRTLQAILVIGAAALALKVGKTIARRKNNGRPRRRQRGTRAMVARAGYEKGLTGEAPYGQLARMSPKDKQAYLRGYARGERRLTGEFDIVGVTPQGVTTRRRNGTSRKRLLQIARAHLRAPEYTKREEKYRRMLEAAADEAGLTPVQLEQIQLEAIRQMGGYMRPLRRKRNQRSR